jgi:hypothetical protein
MLTRIRCLGAQTRARRQTDRDRSTARRRCRQAGTRGKPRLTERTPAPPHVRHRRAQARRRAQAPDREVRLSALAVINWASRAVATPRRVGGWADRPWVVATPCPEAEWPAAAWAQTGAAWGRQWPVRAVRWADIRAPAARAWEEWPAVPLAEACRWAAVTEAAPAELRWAAGAPWVVDSAAAWEVWEAASAAAWAGWAADTAAAAGVTAEHETPIASQTPLETRVSLNRPENVNMSSYPYRDWTCACRHFLMSTCQILKRFFGNELRMSTLFVPLDRFGKRTESTTIVSGGRNG